MELLLRVTSCLGLPPDTPMEIRLADGGCTLGRSPDNDLALHDPERLVSTHHARIDARDGGFWLTDQSTNGTFVNHSPQRAPEQQPVRLADGDVLTVGPYELSVSLGNSLGTAGVVLDAEPLPGMSGPAPDIMDLLGDGGPATGREPADAHAEAFPDAVTLDPFLANPSGGEATPLESPPQPSTRPPAQRTPVEQVHFRPPQTRPRSPAQPPTGRQQGIPEHYDLLNDALGPPSTDAVPALGNGVGNGVETGAVQGAGRAATPQDPMDDGQAVEPTRPEPVEPGDERGSDPIGTWPDPFAPVRPSPAMQAEAATPPATPADSTARPAQPVRGTGPTAARETESAPPSPDSRDALAAFLEGLGTGDASAVDAPLELLRESGALLRAMTAGLTATMLARASFKSELRLGMTRIRAIENNPFKLSVDTDDALERLLLRRNPAFLGPEESCTQAFDDIQAHEMAMISGLRAALRALLARFEPGALEERLGAGGGLQKLLPGARGARLWELFNDTYDQVAADAADDFMPLFGDAFTRAYEDQILRLNEARHPAPDRAER